MRISPSSWRWTQDSKAVHRNLLQLDRVSADEGLMSNTSVPAHPSEKHILITAGLSSLQLGLLSDLIKTHYELNLRFLTEECLL